MDLCFARGLTFKKTPSDSSVPGMKVTKVAKSRRAPSPKAARNKADSFCTVLFVYTKERRLKGVEQLVQGHTASRRDHDSSSCQFLTTALCAASWSQGWKHSPVPARVYLADGMKLWSLWEQLSSGSLRQVRKSSMASLPTEGHTNSSQQKGRHLLMEESMKWPCSTSKNQPRSRFNYQLQKIRRPC